MTTRASLANPFYAVGYEAWAQLAIARGFEQHESPDEFYVVATNAQDEIVGEFDGESGKGWVS